MSKVVSIHSFCRGTGKTNLVANLAALLAMEGHRVCAVDTDLSSPGLHTLFGLCEDETGYRLNDYLSGKCGIEDTVHDMTQRLGPEINGQLFLIPSSTRIPDITRLLCEGCEMDLLNEGFRKLREAFKLDVLMVDTHAGLSEETLVSFALTDVLTLVLDPKRGDCKSCQGTAVTVDVARKLETPPRMLLIVNKVPDTYDLSELKEQVEEAYRCEVAAVLPLSTEMMALGSGGIFVLYYPMHFITTVIKQIADGIVR